MNKHGAPGSLLLAFFLLAALVLIVVYAAAPSIYTQTLLLQPSVAARYPFPVTLLLVAILVLIAVVMIGVLRHWRWLYWLLLIAFAAMIPDIPATILQLTGVVPSLFPLWYSLCRMGVAMLSVGIAICMVQIYRHHGVWARGR